MSSGYTDVATVSHPTIMCAMQIGVSYTDNWHPQISLNLVELYERSLSIGEYEKFKRLDFDTLNIVSSHVTKEALEKALSYYKDPRIEDSGNLPEDHPRVMAARILMVGNPNNISQNMWASGC